MHPFSPDVLALLALAKFFPGATVTESYVDADGWPMKHFYCVSPSGLILNTSGQRFLSIPDAVSDVIEKRIMKPGAAVFRWECW